MAKVPTDLFDELRELKRRLRDLEKRAGARPALNRIENGSVVISEGGQLIARTPDGVELFTVGQTPEGDWGIGAAREDGTPAVTVGTDVDTGRQVARVWSRNGNVLVTDDVYSDEFLGRPSLPVPFQSTPRMATASTSLVTAWTALVRVTNPVFYGQFETLADVATNESAEVVFEVAGPGESYRVVEQWTSPAGWHIHEVVFPLSDYQFMDQVAFRVRHRSVGGAAIETDCLGAYTREAFNSEEGGRE